MSLGALVWREPRPSDAEALGRMHQQVWVDTYSDLLPPGYFDEHGPEERIALWRRVIAEPLPAGVRRVTVFDGDAGPVGWCIAGPGLEHEGVRPARTEALWALYVATDHLGTGLGQQLLEWALADRPAELWTARGNERAISFYRRNGFVADGTRVQDSRFPLVELRMVR
ncbi:GNAT family N-acetyltransferase [Phycicoccus sp. HDW14]|uniref:GNAT family N-acetyltransferase n=1 Tax=Phycicoccus sp. HDW14 TaxID=2714941 RepID=UPI00140BDAAC|nr:GNAT family N-acetyltransferase [Phycicoccus sp. HDW14]QIM21015.1 GNAT family N-acetyltransferase [Phycicoccus sp. HDW14]